MKPKHTHTRHTCTHTHTYTHTHACTHTIQTESRTCYDKVALNLSNKRTLKGSVAVKEEEKGEEGGQGAGSYEEEEGDWGGLEKSARLREN